MDLSFESDDNSTRPLYAHELTASDPGEEPEHETVTPSPSSIGPATSIGPSTPQIKQFTASRAPRSPVSTLAATITEGTPEWYLKKLQDKTINSQHLSSLQTILRGKETSWITHFVELRGMSALAHRLYQFSQKKNNRDDITTEQEIVKCITYILNQRSSTDIALSYHVDIIVTHIASALNTPHLPTRRLILDILVFLVYWHDGRIYNLVISALETLSEEHGESGGCYAYWFKSLQATLSARGKSSASAGASPQVQRRGSEAEAALMEYLMSNILLMNGIMEAIDDVDVRLHHRCLMESSGLHNIARLSRELGIGTIDKQLDLFQQTLDDDQESLDERSSLDHSCNLVNVEDVFKSLCMKTDNTKAKDHLLSILQHLLLVPDDTPDFVHHFQLIDTMVADLVMDPKLGGAEKRFGLSVEQMVSQMNQVERTQKLEEDLVKVRSAALEAKLEKEDMEDRLARSEEMIMHLQTVISRLDSQLPDHGPHTPTNASKAPEAPQAGYNERIAQLAAEVEIADSPRGLFRTPLLEIDPERKAEKDSDPAAGPTSPEPAKLSFWGLTSSWLGMRQASTDGQAADADNEKVVPTAAVVAV